MNLKLGYRKSIDPQDGQDSVPIYLSDEARDMGTYVIGTTGTGKSTFLQSLILQDIYAGHGVCVLDPHGDLIDGLLPSIPWQRRDEVILFDPAQIQYPFGLNLLSCYRNDPRQRDLVTSGLMDTLYKLFDYSWGPRMEDLLRHSIQTLLYSPDSTFLELLLILTNHKHRARLRAPACAADAILRHYWEQQFPESYEETVSKPLKSGGHDRVGTGRWKNPREQVDLVSSALNKIGRFLVNPVVRNIIAQPHNTFNFRQVMDEGQILLVNLSKGDVGSDNSSFLGSVLVNQLLLAALTRREIPQNERRPFYLYVDEYQSFATEAFPQLQSEARKFRIITTVAHQYRDQLDENNKGSTLNVANLIVFRVSGQDALELSGQFDNTPIEFPPHYQPVMSSLGGGFYVQPQTSGSGSTVYQELPGMREPYSDVRMETANILAMLPQYQAIVRLVDTLKGRTMEQYRIRTEPFRCNPDPKTASYIRRRSEAMGTPVKEVEANIRNRMASSIEYLPRETDPFIVPFGDTISSDEEQPYD